MIYLTVILDGMPQKEYVLDKQIISFGRAPENDVCIENIGVSAHHAKIYSGNLLIEDLKSSNGTYVNEQKINTQLLENGDVIKIGKFDIHFHHSGEELHDLSPLAPTYKVASTKASS
jgi:pSer/pThr/pTyr-binding forkhead associated (FHA) protein